MLRRLGVAAIGVVTEPLASLALESDEFEETFEDQAIGIELEDVRKTVKAKRSQQ